MKQFVQWLSTTSPSVFIQTHNAWAIPAVQSVHIMGIAMIVGSAFMIDLRIFGWAGTDQTLRQTADRFAPWLKGALWLLLATGILLIVGEPERELITFSFWAKMFLVALIALVAAVFHSQIRKHETQWDQTPTQRASLRWMAFLTFLILLCIIVLGRLIAYDHVWGILVAVNQGLMDITAYLKPLEDSGFAAYIRASLLFFPMLEALHVLALALVVGTIMVFDLRLLGFASANRSAQRVADEILKWTWTGFALAALTGAMMFITNARVYYHNGFFRAKMLMLVLAAINMFIFERTDKRTMQRWHQDPAAPPAGRAVAVVSLGLWMSIIVLGRIIGFTTTHAVATPPPGDNGVNFDDFLKGAPASAPQDGSQPKR